jgi:hypothetical protein
MRSLVPEKEHERGVQPGAFVPVEEGLRLRDVKRIGRRHLEKVVVEKLSAERRGRHRDCGFDRPTVADAVRAAPVSKLVAMNFDNLLEGEKLGVRGHSARRLNVSACRSRISACAARKRSARVFARSLRTGPDSSFFGSAVGASVRLGSLAMPNILAASRATCQLARRQLRARTLATSPKCGRSAWFQRVDSNHDKRNQNPLSCH